MAFCLALLGGCLLFGGSQTVDDAEKFDTKFEQVTLAKWVEGQTTNKALFEVSSFEIGDHYWTSKSQYRNRFGMVYVPLFQPGEKDNTGAAIVAVVGLPNCSNADVKRVFLAKSLSLQDHREDAPAPAMNLSQAYPEIDWSRTRWAVVDPTLPDMPMGPMLRGIGALLCLLSAIAGFLGVVLWFWSWKPERREVAKVEARNEVPEIVEAAEIVEATVNHESVEDHQTIENQFVSKASEPSFMSDKLPRTGRICRVVAIIGLLLMLSVVVLNWMFGLLGSSIATPTLYLALPMLLIGGVVSALAHFFAVPKLRIEPKMADQISRKAHAKLESISQEFQEYGFQFMGFAEANILGAKRELAYLQSSNREAAVEVVWQKGKISYTILGVTNDGLIYEVGKRSSDAEIDGTSFGIPIAAKLKAKTDIAAVIEDFGTFYSKVNANGCRLLQVPSECLFHLMHYETILRAWWTHKSSKKFSSLKRFSKPEPMPKLEELSEDGAVFSFNRDDSYSHAFEKAAVVVIRAKLDKSSSSSSVGESNSRDNSSGEDEGHPAVQAAGVPAPTATAGGEELFSARFFNSSTTS